MAFRRSVPQAELREKMSAEELQRHATAYSARQGGWVKTKPKPVPGTPKKGN